MEKVRLGDVCTINGGYAFKSDQFSTEGVPVIRIGNITKEGLIIDEDVCYDENFWNENDSYRIAKNDILIAMSGATVGKSCINNTERKLLLNQRVAAINCDNNINLKYIFYSIDSEKFSKYIMTNSIGCAQPNISLKQISNFEIPAVCREEQNRIADELDKVTDVINKRKQQISKLDELVKARFVELFGDKGYPEDTLLNLCNIIDYRGKTPEKLESGLPFITAKNVRMHQMNLEPREYISKETYDKVMVRGFPKEGDVVFTTEAPLGNVCRIPHFDTEFYIGQRIVTLQTKKLDPIYLEYALSSDDFKMKYMGKSSGSTVTGIRVRLLEQLTIPVPPIELQSQFATFVEQTDKSKLEVQKSLDKLEVLKKALMQKYFG